MAALLTAAGQVALGLLGLLGLNALLDGKLFEIWRKVTDPEFFELETSEQEAYFESLDLHFSLLDFLLPAGCLLLGLLLAWVGNSMMRAMAARVTLSDLRDRPVDVVESLRLSLRRVPRLMGVDIQIVTLIAAPMVLVGGLLLLAAVAQSEPAIIILMLLMLLLVPAWLICVILAYAVLVLPQVVAAAGPPRSSLLYSRRLVKGRFWPSLGRALLVLVVTIAAGLAVGMVFSVTGAALDGVLRGLSLLTLAPQAVAGAALGVVSLVALTILYDDLGGESD